MDILGGPTPEEIARAQAIRDSNSGDEGLDLVEQQRLADKSGVGDAYRSGFVSSVYDLARELGGVVRTDDISSS